MFGTGNKRHPGCVNNIIYATFSVEGTSNCLAEFQNLLKLTQIFLNFLYDKIIRNILPEINITSSCSFPPGVTNMLGLNYRFLWKAPNFYR